MSSRRKKPKTQERNMSGPMDLKVPTDELGKSPTQEAPAMEVTPLSLESLRMKEAQELATAIAAKAEQFNSDPTIVTRDSLRAVLKASKSLVSKLMVWAEPPPQLKRSEKSRKLGRFPRFPKLPVEVQLMIWRYAMPSPRILTLLHELDTGLLRKLEEENDWEPFGPDSRQLLHAWRNDFTKYKTTAFGKGVPMLLRVCQQSRNEALRVYTLSLSMRDVKCLVRLDPKLDTIHFAWKGMRSSSLSFETGMLWKKEVLNSIQHLAFDDKRLDYLLQTDRGNPFRNFLALSDLSIICHDEGCRLREFHHEWLRVHFVPAEASSPTRVLQGGELDLGLERRFATFLTLNPGWHSPRVVRKRVTVNKFAKSCCDMTWKEWDKIHS